MAPKTNCNAVKLANVVAWMQKSCTAHSFKDLEKALPSIASINGMQVKDYVQALADENKINCEKIGSGNWYWSFSSEAKKTAAANLSSAQATHAKQAQINEELQAKLAAAAASREDEADEMLDGGESREELSLKQASLDQQCKELMKDLACYVNDDPTELERKMEEAEKLKAAAMQWTEDIEEMEGWFKTRTEGQPDQFQELMQSFYGNEYDEENCVLRELV